MDWNRDIGLLIINILMLAICILLVKKRHILKPYGNYMIAAMVLTYLIDCVAFYIRFTDIIDRIYTTYIYIYGSLGLFFLIIFLMYQNLIKNMMLKNIARVLITAFIFFYAYQILTLNISEGFPELILYINVFLLLFMIALFLLDTFQTDIILEIKKYYPFWFSLGLIIIYMVMIPSVIISKSTTTTMTNGLWSFITFIINIIGYGILFVGLLQAKKITR